MLLYSNIYTNICIYDRLTNDTFGVQEAAAHLLLDVRPLDRMRPVSPNSLVRPESVDRSHFFTVLMRALASSGARKLSKVTTLCRSLIN